MQFEPRWAHPQNMNHHPLFQFMELDCWYEADHQKKTAVIMAASGTTDDRIESFRWFVEEAAAGIPKHTEKPLNGCGPGPLSLEEVSALGEMTAAEYYDTIRQILEDIAAGRYYELNLTQRFRTRSTLQPSQLFVQLTQTLNPAYVCYLQFPEQTIISASPELFLHKQGAEVQTCPIKGSFKGHPGPAGKDKLLAEHIMVVDLARNDLGRVSDLQWVNVPELSVVKSFGEISHLESRVAGRTSLRLHEILPSTYPAASITGMPKVMVVDAISNYEKSPRGVYTGACGIIWNQQEFQLNVAIRTLHACPSGVQHSLRAANEWSYTLGAGGAIVADSDPEEEYRECLEKARPLLSPLLKLLC